MIAAASAEWFRICRIADAIRDWQVALFVQDVDRLLKPSIFPPIAIVSHAVRLLSIAFFAIMYLLPFIDLIVMFGSFCPVPVPAVPGAFFTVFIIYT